MEIALMIQYFDFETLMNKRHRHWHSLMKSEKSKMVFGIFSAWVYVWGWESEAIIRFVIWMCEYEEFHTA